MFSTWRWKLSFLRVGLDAVPSPLLLGTAQHRWHSLAHSPGYTTCSEFSLQKWASCVVLFVACECKVLHPCLNMSAVCVLVWGHVCVPSSPSHSRKYQYKLFFFFFFLECPLRMVIANCWIITEDLTGGLTLVTCLVVVIALSYYA